MNKELKIKIIVYGIIAIMVLFLVILFLSYYSKNTKKENDKEINLTADNQQDFTVDDMMKINDNTSNTTSGESVLSRRKDRTYNFDDDKKDEDTVYEEEDEEILLLQETLRKVNTRQAVTTVTDNNTINPVTYTHPVQPEPKEEKINAEEPPKIKEEIPDEPKPKNRNRFFRGEQELETGNTISAVVHGEQTVSNKSTLKMRLLEDAYSLDGQVIPRGTYIYGVVNITQERILINIETVRIGKSIYNLKRTVYDMDGIQGINVPENIKAEIAKKATAQTIQETNTSTTGGNILEKTAGTVGTAAKNILSKDAQEVKVTIKSNYKIYLK